jgi:archaellum biogenesis ATPase FlaH
VNLSQISFGDRVAENESAQLANYFIETEQWNSLYAGNVDVVFGSKGAGKSALYTLLMAQKKDFSDERNISLISAEKATGTTVFSDIRDVPPTSEKEFITLWKIYIVQLIIEDLIKNNKCFGQANEVKEKLIEANLIEENNTLKRLLNKAKTFAKRLIELDSIEAGATLDSGVTGKITFKTPSDDLHKRGYISVDELLEKINNYSVGLGYSYWLLFDRLDVAFDQSISLEKNALRALFKVYRDIEEYQSIRLKIFLRDDIWKRITEEGFREASHITRYTTIAWQMSKLLNLIVIRALDSIELVQAYNVQVDEVKADYQKQRDFYYKLFPAQVDIGEKQSETFDWIANRVKDGFGNIAPRELIHFYNEVLRQELREKAIGNNKIEDGNLVSRQAIKNSLFEVSKAKVEQNLYAENSHLKKYISSLENQKAELDIKSLSSVWEIPEKETESVAMSLAEIGFFEQRIAKMEKIFKIPFLYRPYLNIIQGKSYEAVNHSA